MVCQHMLAQMCHFPAFQMNHLSTLLAFAMKAYMLMTMLIMSQILEACTAGAVYHIFGNQSLLHHPVKLAVHRCGSDRNPLTFKVFTYIADCNMFSFHRAQIILQLCNLSGTILCFFAHFPRLQFENHFHIIADSFSKSI